MNTPPPTITAATDIAPKRRAGVLPAGLAGIGRSAKGQRYLSIDILRAVAILLMIQVHFVEHLAYAVSSKFASPEYLYELSGMLGLIPAPLFVVLTGLSYSLWLGVQQRSGRSEDEIARYSFRRGMFLFVLGFAVNILIWTPESTFNWDILTLLGAAAVIITWVRNWHPGILVAICVVIVLAAPPLRDLAHYESYWINDIFQYDTNLKDVLLGFVVNGYFPLFPWLAYSLAGFVLGQSYYPHNDEEDASLPIVLLLLGTGLVGLAFLGALFEPHVPAWASKYYFNEWPDDLNPATTVFVLASLGGVIACMWPLNYAFDRNRWVTGTGRILTFFRRYSHFALTAYVAHLAVHLWPMWIALALWPKSSIETFLGDYASAWTSLGAAIGFICLFYLVTIWLERHRKYSIEYFLRWSCD